MAAMHAAALATWPPNAACPRWHNRAAASLQSAPQAALSSCWLLQPDSCCLKHSLGHQSAVAICCHAVRRQCCEPAECCRGLYPCCSTQHFDHPNAERATSSAVRLLTDEVERRCRGHADELIKPVKVYMRRMGEVLGEEASFGSMGGSSSPQVGTCWQHTCKGAVAPVLDAKACSGLQQQACICSLPSCQTFEALKSLSANLAQLHN